MSKEIFYTAKEAKKDVWKIHQHVKGQFKRVVCEMTTEDIMELYESVTPEYQEEILVAGNPGCKHAWRPYHLNDKFKLCNSCDAILKIKRLVPRRYE